MRATFALAAICLALAGCEAQTPATRGVSEAAPAPPPAFTQPPLRALASAPTAPKVCVEAAESALQARLVLDGRWAVDPVAGAISARGLNYNIPTHSVTSLETGLARYGSLREGVGGAGARTAALITYAGEGESCAWLVSGAGIVAYGRSGVGMDVVRADVSTVMETLGIEAAQEARAPTVRAAGAAPGTRSVAAAPLETLREGELATALAHVAESVLPPEIVARLPEFDSLIVVPHAGLARFPFMLLPNGRTEGRPAYLTEHMSLQIAPSLSEIGIGPGLHLERSPVLASMDAAQRHAALAGALVVGDPRYQDTQFDMPQLPGAAAEASAVGQSFGATPLLGEQATLAAVRARLSVPRAARPMYLHFATHGLADRDEVAANGSFLALANGDRLTINDVGALRMAPGAVIVLSACQTGLGASRPGGVIGLPRAFQLAGAQTVIMSLWNVDDAATRYLMTAFATELEATGRPATAFATAVRKTRAQYPDPRLWASFEVFGVAPP